MDKQNIVIIVFWMLATCMPILSKMIWNKTLDASVLIVPLMLVLFGGIFLIFADKLLK
jgi:hypothetical protein